jgi:type I restriction enzyme S subunit
MLEIETKVQRYERYKESGISWLEAVPEHWELKRFKHIFKEKKITHNVALNCGSISFGKVVYKDDEKVPVSTKKSYQVLNKGEFLINPLNLNYDLISLRIGLSDKDVVVSSGYIIVQNDTELSKDYYKWLLHIFDIAFMKTLGSGVRQTLSFTHIANSELVFPPLSEQTAIAQFLDDKTTKIDDSITIKQQQISLLKERKQILIHKAVTRGLNPNVKLKDSGMEWIGEIPVGWKITYLKRYCLKVTDGSHHSPQTQYEGKSYISVKDVNEFGEIDTINCKKINQKDFDDLARNGCKPKKNDILLTKDGTIGRAAIVNTDNDFVVLSSLGIITPDLKEFDSKFLRYYLISPLCVSQMNSLIAGSALTRLTIEKINRLFVIIPPLSEQKEIVVYLDDGSKKIETAISLKQQEITKLKEYKSSLINSVVTGKVKVC